MAKKLQKSDAEKRDFQEQKNHQDFVYETNTKLQALSQSILDVLSMVQSIKSKSESDHKSLMIEFENFRELISCTVNKIESRLGDVQSKVDKHLSDVKIEHRHFVEKFVDKDTFIMQLSSHLEKILLNTELVSKTRSYLEGGINRVQSLSQTAIAECRLNLLDLILREDPSKKEFDDRLKIYKEDFDSLYKEMTDLKLAFGCVQKKFEHALRVEKQQEVKQ